jgi:hypothetical protein
MTKLVEIYGLYDPDSGDLRYVGKANSTAHRLKTHILERNLDRPICRWVKSLVEQGKCPRAVVFEAVPEDQWEEAERRLIAEHRKTSDLLNLADGGAMPSQTKDQRRKLGRSLNKKLKAKTPQEQRFIKAKQDMARLLFRFMKDGDKTGNYSHAYRVRFLMRLYYADDPKGHASWANL